MNGPLPHLRSSSPTISILLPVFNNEAFLAEAITSIQQQTFSDFEFIISVDRESRDRSLEIVDAFAQKDPRIVRRLVPRSRIGGNLNHVIPEARGRYIALMEADDIALPNRLQIQYDWMENNQADICGGAQQLFGTHNRVRWFPETHAGIRAELLFTCALHPSSVMVKTNILQKHLFDPDVLWQDYELWTRMIPHQIFANIPHILAKIRTHDQQTSVQYVSEMTRDRDLLRKRYFDACFPDARKEMYDAFTRINDRKPMQNLAQLQEAGAFLLRAADVPEAGVRHRMAVRWYETCLDAAPLGAAVYTIFLSLNHAFGVETNVNLLHLKTLSNQSRRTPL